MSNNMRSEILKNSMELNTLLTIKAEEVDLPFGIFRAETSQTKNLRETIALIEQSETEDVVILFGIFSAELTFSQEQV